MNIIYMYFDTVPQNGCTIYKYVGTIIIDNY